MKASIFSNRLIGYALTVGMMGAPVAAQASTVSTFDVLVATDNLTVVGTATVQGNGFSVGNSTFVVQQGRIGIGTATLTQQFQMVGIQPYGSDDFTQFVWFSTRGALRAGGKILAFPDPWSADRIGLYSTAFGLGNDARGDQAFVGGGALNVARAPYTVIGGGGNNLADGSYAVIAGGPQNDTTDSAATVSGGFSNLAANYASVGGGYLNIASAQYATIPGGRYNIASGTDSFAAGYNASAEGTGSFVWADAGGPQFRSTVNNEFKARANGGFVLVGSAGATTIVSSGSFTLSTAPTAGSAMPNIYISSINGNVGIGKTAPATALDVNGAITASSATFTATGSSIYSLTSSSGIHILAGGITWPDGTISTTAASSGGSSGDASLASTQTFSGANTFTGTTIFGGSSQAQEQAMPSILARSFDGATQSSGCLVALAMESPGGLGATSTSRLIFTSTTTVSAVGMLGVLLETCAPGSDCRIAITGLVRVRARSACASGNHGAAIMSTWSTRCETSCGVAALGNGIVGTVLSDNWSSGWAWFWMR